MLVSKQVLIRSKSFIRKNDFCLPGLFNRSFHLVASKFPKDTPLHSISQVEMLTKCWTREPSHQLEVSSSLVGSSGNCFVNRHSQRVMTQARSVHAASATKAQEIAVEARENYHHYGVLFLDEVSAGHLLSSSHPVSSSLLKHPKVTQ